MISILRVTAVNKNTFCIRSPHLVCQVPCLIHFSVKLSISQVHLASNAAKPEKNRFLLLVKKQDYK